MSIHKLTKWKTSVLLAILIHMECIKNFYVISSEERESAFFFNAFLLFVAFPSWSFTKEITVLVYVWKIKFIRLIIMLSCRKNRSLIFSWSLNYLFRIKESSCKILFLLFGERESWQSIFYFPKSKFPAYLNFKGSDFRRFFNCYCSFEIKVKIFCNLFDWLTTIILLRGNLDWSCNYLKEFFTTRKVVLFNRRYIQDCL